MSEGDLYIGLMSGTSMDAVDAALVAFTETQTTLLAYEEFPIQEELRAAVRRVNSSSTVGEVTKLDNEMGMLFADVVCRLLEKHEVPSQNVKALGNHGQTVVHLPDDSPPRTLQIGDPNIIALKTGITTISDFRRMDMADGGQGAPLAPAFHDFAFRQSGAERIILNLGGIANISLLPSDPNQPITGFDTGPGNGLLDDWNQKHQGSEMDRDSQWAASGKVIDRLLSGLLSDTYFAIAPAKSTGRDYFNLSWLSGYLNEMELQAKPEDVQATLLALTIESIACAVEQHGSAATEIYACGGGAKNWRLMQSLQDRLPAIKVRDTSSLGMHPDAIEAVTFAWLAKQTIEGMPGNRPEVTAAQRLQILGGIYQSYS